MSSKVLLAMTVSDSTKEAGPSPKREHAVPRCRSAVDQILHLQQTIGNQAVQRLLKTGVLQTKLHIGRPGDIYEQEADRLAEQVMKMAEPQAEKQPADEEQQEQTQPKPVAEEATPLVQRQIAEEKKEEEELQTRQTPGHTPEATPDLESRINALKGGGQPLARRTRAYFEQRFGQGFSGVRVHADTEAAKATRALNAQAFTVGWNVVFAAGQYAPQTTSGKKLLSHELAHVVQQTKSGSKRINKFPNGVEGAKIAAFDLAKWFHRFEKSVTFALSQLYVGRDVVSVKQIEDIKDTDDETHPAHYNPNDRTIYFSKSGFRFIYNDRVLNKKEWTEQRYYDFVVETAAEEAFHAYQDAPRHRSKKFAEFEKSVDKKLLSKFGEYIESGVIDTYEKFKTLAIPHFTKLYLPDSKVKEFMGENLPGFRRDPKWQLTAREEIMNQWLHILEDHYFRARTIESTLRKGITGKGLEEEKRYKVSLIEKQAKKFAKMRRAEVKLWLLARELEGEKDTSRKEELKKRINTLKTETDLKNIPTLQERLKYLKAEFMRLDPNRKNELSRIEKVVKEWMELEDRLDSLISLRDGIQAIFRKERLLIPR
jgi:hypothetical protein